MADSLRAVAFSEFDNHMGTQLRHQWPLDTLSKESFEVLSEYVIVQKQLANRVIVVKRDTLQFANYSVAIENSKYHRNTLFFSLGVVLDRDADTKPFEVVLRKTSSMLVALEEESEFLFKAHENDNLCNLVRALYTQLKVYETPSYPEPIHEWQVPMLLFHRALISGLPWESTLNHVIPYIDGRRTVKQVSSEGAIDVDLVKKAVRVLMWYGIAFVTDVIKFSNRYQATENINQVNTDGGMDEICRLLHGDGSRARVTPNRGKDHDGDRAGDGSGSGSGNGGTKPPRRQSLKQDEKAPVLKEAVRMILYALHPGVTVRDLCLQCLRNKVDVSKIDIARLLAIAAHMGLIRRIYDYPVSEYALDNQYSLRFLQGADAASGDVGLGEGAGSKAFSVGSDLNKYVNQYPSFQDFSLAHGDSTATLDIELELQAAAQHQHKLENGGGGSDGSDSGGDHDRVNRGGRRRGHDANDKVSSASGPLLKVADGSRHLDDLCCELQLSLSALQDLPTFVYIRK